MIAASNHVPDDKDALKAALIEARVKKQREMFGPRSERSQWLIDQMELQLEELAAGGR